MFITADKIHDGRKWLPENSVIEVADDGTIVAIHKNYQGHIVRYDGIICPGFVNVHCHLELSHMKGVIPEKTGLISFLQNVMQRRSGFTDKQKQQARYEAFNAMLENGVVAVGDIANTTDTADLRASGKMHFQTFIEALGFTPSPDRQYNYALDVFDAFAGQQSNMMLRQSIVPHAPYSVSNSFFTLIDEHQKDAVLSIHNQESAEEDLYYKAKQGGIQTLLHGLGINDEFFTPSGKSSIQTYMEWMSPSHPYVFVHNTFTTVEDVKYVKGLLPKHYWCFCPNANLYIENCLPDIPMFMEQTDNICIGTDSLSSNHQLSVLAELQTINSTFPEIGWEKLLQWGTYNGACALQMDGIVGSIETGKQAGLLHLIDVEAENIRIEHII